MGWYLFRRKTLTVLCLVLCFSNTPLFSESLPCLFNIEEIDNKNPRPAHAILPQQGHRGPEVFFIPVAENEAVKNELKQYSAAYNFSLLKKVYLKSLSFRNMIIAEIEKRNLPPELVFIPFIESHYNPRALSRSGAAGLWQLMRVCVVKRPLIIDEWIDERYDFWKSTQIALDVIQDLYAYYNDWPLVLAAYNCGITKLNKIIKRSGIRDFWELCAKGLLPKQTAHYVPRILAVARLCSYPGRNGLPYLWNKEINWCRISLSMPVDLKKLAQVSGVSYAVLKESNSELKFRVTPPASYNYKLKVPLGMEKQIRDALSCSGQELIDYYIHTVYSGETLYGIAQYYKISAEHLTFYNPHVSAAHLKIGMKLIIPVLHDSVPKPLAKRNFTGKKFCSVYRVEQGDTLFNIAMQYKVPIEELLYHNGLNYNSIIKAGDRLKVPYKYTD
ncbi:MAG: transglycosylase SLT domain-containing protein [Spirochaetales bacterium]|nr:transglycosylase SLT domain-containing protein [Spirochaetales bacterium]